MASGPLKRKSCLTGRVHADIRARAHADPLSAMAANMEDTERELRDAKGEIAKLVYVVLPSRCGSLPPRPPHLPMPAFAARSASR